MSNVYRCKMSTTPVDNAPKNETINNGRDKHGRPYQRYICPCGASAGVQEVKDGTRKFIPHFPKDKTFEDTSRPIQTRGPRGPSSPNPPVFAPTSDEVIVKALTADVNGLTEKLETLGKNRAEAEALFDAIDAEIEKFSKMKAVAEKRLSVFTDAGEVGKAESA